MALETVEAVRKAELAALEKERDARANGDKLLFAAQQQAKDIMESLKNELYEESIQIMKQAQQQANAAINAATKKAENEITRLKQIANQKEQAAIDLIISEIIE